MFFVETDGHTFVPSGSTMLSGSDVFGVYVACGLQDRVYSTPVSADGISIPTCDDWSFQLSQIPSPAVFVVHVARIVVSGTYPGIVDVVVAGIIVAAAMFPLYVALTLSP